MTLCICYHGTSKQNAESIMKTGFKKWTYFAKHLEDSIGYGGEYVFEVQFEKDKLKDNWQFINHEVIPPSRIVGLTKYDAEELYDNSELRQQIFESNLAEYNNSKQKVNEK